MPGRARNNAASAHDRLVESLRNGGQPPRDKVLLAYGLDRKGQGSPRSLEAKAFELKNDATVDEHVRSVLGPDPGGKYASEGEEVRRVGLVNMGNTCYINSVLQCLSRFDVFSRLVLELQSSDDATKELQKTVAKLVRRGGRARYVDPKTLVEALQVCASEQQDAHEFYRLLVDYLATANEDAANNEEFKAGLRALLEGGVMYSTECLACGNVARRHETTNELTVPLAEGSSRTATLEACLDAVYQTPAKLDGENQYECPKCNGKQDAERKTRMGKLPDLLMVVVCRFVYDKKKQAKVKKTKALSFPRVLDMERWVARPEVSKKYKLYATIHHIGDGASQGHYVARCTDRGDGAAPFYQYNDTTVTHDGKYSLRSTERVTSDDAYFLIYEAVNEDGSAAAATAAADPSAPLGPSAQAIVEKAEAEEAHEHANVLTQQAAYLTKKERLLAGSSSVVECGREISKRSRSENFPGEATPLESYCFVSNYWMHAFGHGKFLNPDVETVQIQPVDPEAKVRQEIVFVRGASGGDDVSEETQPTPVVATGSSRNHVIHRDPFHPGNFAAMTCEHAGDGDVAPIDPRKIKGVKIVHKSVARMLSEAVRVEGGPEPHPLRTAESRLCTPCVSDCITQDDDVMRESEKRSNMIAVADIQMAEGEEGFWVGVQWWNEFKKKASNREWLLRTDVFEGARCAHGGLCATQHTRRLIPSSVYNYLVHERSFFASEPALLNTTKTCAECQRQYEKDTTNFNQIQGVKKMLMMELRPLVEAVKDKDSATKLIGKDWVKERKTLRQQWQTQTAKMKKEEEARKKREEKERIEAELPDIMARFAAADPVTTGEIACPFCDAKVPAAEWSAHIASTEHISALKASGAVKKHYEYHHARTVLQEIDRRAAAAAGSSSSDLVSDTPPSPRDMPGRRPKRGTKRAADGTEKTDDGETCEGDEEEGEDEEVEEVEEEEEEEEEDPYREPASFLNARYIFVERGWGARVVSWFQSPTKEGGVEKPEAADVRALFYCEHGDLKYDARFYLRGAAGRKVEGHEGSVGADFVLVPEECAGVLRQTGLLDESGASVPVFHVCDEEADVVVAQTDPTPCAVGCPELEVQRMRERLLNFRDGTLKLEPAKNARKNRRISPTTLYNVSSDDTVLVLLHKIHDLLGVDPRMMELSCGELPLTQAPDQPLSFFGVQNCGTVHVAYLDNVNIDVARAMDGIPDEVADDRERGFSDSRLHGTARGVDASPQPSPQQAPQAAGGGGRGRGRGRGSGGGGGGKGKGGKGGAAAAAPKSFTCPVCTFINEGSCGPPCGMCGS